MRTFQLEQTDKEIISHAGLALVGIAVTKYTVLAQAIDVALPKRHGTPSSDIIKTYLGLLAQGKNDFGAINDIREDRFFHQALDLQKAVPTEASIRLRIEQEAERLELLIMSNTGSSYRFCLTLNFCFNVWMWRRTERSEIASDVSLVFSLRTAPSLQTAQGRS